VSCRRGAGQGGNREPDCGADPVSGGRTGGRQDREKAKIGVFITLAEPTGPMKTEAIKTGFYESPLHGKFPKVQILTIKDLFAGKKPQIPFVDASAFKAAPKEDTSKQGKLL
jgi:hypothetical protein